MTDHRNWQEGVLTRFSPRVREKMLSLAESFTYPAGQVIFKEGDPSLHLYIVKSGCVSIEVRFPARGSRTVMTVEPGEVFSWSALVEPRIETATARTLEDTEVVAIKGGLLMDICREDPEFGLQLYRTLAEVITARLVSTRLHMLDSMAWPSVAKAS